MRLTPAGAEGMLLAWTTRALYLHVLRDEVSMNEGFFSPLKFRMKVLSDDMTPTL
jgi:hypothetical protein